VVLSDGGQTGIPNTLPMNGVERTRRRRVAMFLHTFDDRAVARVVATVTDGMDRLGFDTAIVCATRDPRGEVRLRDEIPVVDLRVGRRPTTFGVPQLAAFIRNWRPDVMFAHGNGANRAAVLARLASRQPMHLVLVEHNHYSSYVASTTGGWRHRWLRDALTGVLYPLADRVAGVAPSVTQDLARRFRLPGVKLIVLPNPGPEPDLIAERASGEAVHPWLDELPRPKIICSVGNIIPRKSQETLIESLALVRRDVGDVRLMLIGRRDNEEYAAHLERRADELGVRRHVWFAGYQPDPLALVAKSDVFALASINEGSPLVLVEAMACGVPIVATDCPGGSSYLLDDGRAGIIVPMRDPADMAIAIARVLRDAELRAALVDRGRSRAAQFAPSRVAHQYLAVVESLMSARG